MARAPASQEIEVPPEIDRLEGFPHPRETAVLFGHGGAEQEFASALSSGRMHHAWLLSGARVSTEGECVIPAPNLTIGSR